MATTFGEVSEDGVVRWRDELRPLRDNRIPQLQRTTRAGFARGAEAGWEDLADFSPRTSIPASEGYLEAAAGATHLAVRAESLGLGGA